MSNYQVLARAEPRCGIHPQQSLAGAPASPFVEHQRAGRLFLKRGVRTSALPASSRASSSDSAPCSVASSASPNFAQSSRLRSDASARICRFSTRLSFRCRLRLPVIDTLRFLLQIEQARLVRVLSLLMLFPASQHALPIKAGECQSGSRFRIIPTVS